MNRQNWYFEELVDANNMQSVESSAQGGVKDILVSLQNRGVISGCQIQQTSPTPSLAVLIKAGKLALEDGSIVVVANDRTLDLSPFVPATAGTSVWLTVYGIPVESSDTPVIIPAGTTVNYHIYDDVQYVIVGGTTDFGVPNRDAGTPPGFVGTLIGDILLGAGQAAIANTAIQIDRQLSFTVIGTLQAQINALNAAEAATNASLNNLTNTVGAVQSQVNTIGNKLSLVAAQQVTDDALLASLQAAISTITNVTIPGIPAAITPGIITAVNAQFGLTTSPTGHFKLSNGLIFQWVTGTLQVQTSVTSQTLGFEIHFPTAVLSAIVSTSWQGGNNDDIAMYQITNISQDSVSVRRSRGGSYEAAQSSTPVVWAVGW